MPMMSTITAAQVTGGAARGGVTEFARVSTDSRKIQAGDLFIALRGENYDGHQYAQAALKAGAAAVLVDSAGASAGNPAIIVSDTRLALGLLAAYWRQQMPARIIGITGSSGKTTVKEMLAAILRTAAGDEAVLATPGNLNNDIGMPLTLLSLNAAHQYGVIEMGMNHSGELAYLSRLACPDVVLINNAGAAHLGMLGSMEAIARAKGEILTGCAQTGIAIINADDEYAPLWRELAANKSVLEFGVDASVAAVRATYTAQAAYSDMRINLAGTETVLRLPVPGKHNVMNALAAATAAWALGISAEAIATGLQRFTGIYGRLQYKRGRNGALLIDDSYNANPDSMRAAIQVLAALQGMRLLVLGDMGELGDDAGTAHAEIGAFAKSSGIEGLYTFGELSRQAAAAFGDEAQHFDDMAKLEAALLPRLTTGVTVLVKGSRFMRMERVVEILGADNA
ncbi:MAG: UDP-N-acetylmuramoyl-tripeptide--D-alanyl-D-alanine ligase [Sulfuriferula sp.]